MIGVKQTTMAALLAAGFMLANSAQAKVLYTIKDLGTLGGSESSGAAINASGQVTGSSKTADGHTHAFVTSPAGEMIDLGTLGGSDSYGAGINASGQVTGSSQLTGDEFSHAFVASSGVAMADLGTVEGAGNSGGNGINSHGQVTGWSETSSGVQLGNLGNGLKPFILSTTGVMSLLDIQDDSFGQAINDSGQVVGGLQAGQQNHAFVTTIKGKVIFPANDLNQSSAFAINAAGEITGLDGDYMALNSAGQLKFSGRNRAFIINSKMKKINLGILPGGLFSVGRGINASGQVVGMVEEPEVGGVSIKRAFVTDNAAMRDLNTLLASDGADWQLTEALGINDVGQITGTGVHNGLTHAFLLTPVTIDDVKFKGDSVKLLESQKDEVKCRVIDNQGHEDCYQKTKDTFSASVKLSADHLAEKQIDLTQLNKDTQLGITIGTFTFSGSLNTADQSKLTNTGLQGKWTKHHLGCAKFKADGSCAKPQEVIDETVKILVNSNGAAITLSGKSDVDGNGQKMLVSRCQLNGDGTSSIFENVSVSIGETSISSEIQSSCKVKYESEYTGYPFKLYNMTISTK